MRPLASLAAALALATLAPACHESAEDPPITADDTVLDGDDFVAIPRTVGAETAAARGQLLSAAGAPGELAWGPDLKNTGDFYLAIRKDALDEQWFLSAFLKQYFPGGVNGGAASSLGTRVVSFAIQNDRLYVFDVDNRKANSDVFDPEVLVEAYPIITGWERFERLPGHRNYILIDPAAGLNRFGVVGDAFGAGYVGGDYYPRRFRVELSFLQRFRAIDDGITYEHVFSGYSDDFLPDTTGGVEESYFRASGTLGIALRRYEEGENYTQVPMPGQEHYFRSSPSLVPNQGYSDSVAARWDLYPGMTPVQWHISDALVQYDAERPHLDLVEAVRAGIEGWNDALGFTAFETVLASADESFADDDKNYVIFDPDPSLGYAFANWRTNPNTGEIRGASIYWGAGWVLDGYFDDDVEGEEGDPEALRPAREKNKVTRLTWDSLHADPLCVHWAPTFRGPHRAPESALTAREKTELVVTNMVAHEIGHTLSLRHNFMGSLLAPSSSVMDYNTIEDSLAQPLPGSYDIAAVRYLYGQSPDAPSEPFCTDGEYSYNPDCGLFDTGSDPLNDYHAPTYSEVEDFLLSYPYDREFIGAIAAYYAQPVLGYVRAGDPVQVATAWATVMDRVAAPLSPALAADPTYAAGADALASWMLAELYLSDEAARGYISALPYDESIIASVVDQAGQILGNTDGIRSFESRRQMVDLLEQMQTFEAYVALRAARDQVIAQLEDPAVDPIDAALLADLSARIDAAISPYFD